MTEENAILFDATRAGVGVITLNRPDKHNAFNSEVIERLSDLIDEVRGQDGIRVVLVKGAGKTFSAGADLEWMRSASHYTHQDNVDDANALAEMLHRLSTLPQPTVALVNGPAFGGGLGLIAACDIAVAVRSALFRFSEVHLGLTPATISPYVVQAIGPRWAKALFVSGDTFSAETAHTAGLVHYLVDDLEGLAKEEERIVGQLFKGAPGAIRDAKALVDAVRWREIDAGLRKDTAKRIADRRASEEGKEGLAAFLEKRRPGWAG